MDLRALLLSFLSIFSSKLFSSTSDLSRLSLVRKGALDASSVDGTNRVTIAVLKVPRVKLNAVATGATPVTHVMNEIESGFGVTSYSE